MYSDVGNTPSRALGSPIRTPSDHSSVGSSPRLIAASYVLHRLLVPRHPPCALTHLHSQTIKDARVHCAVLKQHTPTPPTPPANRPTGQKSISGISAIRNNPHPQQTRDAHGAVSDTQQCVLSEPRSPRQPALSRRRRSRRVLRNSVPPNEPPSAPRTGTNQALSLTPPTGEVSAP